MKKILMIGLACFALFVFAMPTEAKKPDSCTTIQSGSLVNSAGETLTTGNDSWGYNYQAQMFKGGYCDSYRNAAWCQPYKEDQLMMKWNDAWMSNKDCDGDGLLDRHSGYASYRGSGAWLTNHQSGEYEDEGGMQKWNYFVKIVAAPLDAVNTNGVWYTADGKEIGPAIWGDFATTMEVYNDSGSGDHGLSSKGARPGFGNW